MTTTLGRGPAQRDDTDDRAPTRSTTLRRAHLIDGRDVDVTIVDGRVASIGAAGASARPTGQTIDLDGRLLLPALAEPHAHLDKTLSATRLGEARSEGDGDDGDDLDGAIARWMDQRPRLSAASYRQRATEALRRAALSGVTMLRTHVDAGFDPTAYATIVDVATSARDAIEVQLVAGAGLPVTGPQGRAGLARLRELLAVGAAAIGGAPSLDPDPVAALEALAELATELGRPLDLHVDETLDPDVFLLPHVATLVDRGFAHPITVAHCVSLAAQPTGTQRAVAEELARTGITVVTLPQTNLYLQGRGHGALAPRGLTALGALRAAGVTVVAGSDNVADAFNPMGRSDPFEIASLLVTAAHLPVRDAFAMVADHARGALGGPVAGPVVGAVADLVAVRARDLVDAIGHAAPDRLVFRGGRLVARTTVHETWLADPGTPVDAARAMTSAPPT